MSEGMFQVTFGISIEVPAESKGEAICRARDTLFHEGLHNYVNLDNPITVVELDANGDPII